MGNNTRYLLRKILLEVFFMKVVLVKSPKFLSGILRMIFGIKKQEM